MLSSCTVLLVSKETKPGNSNQLASSSAGINTGIVTVPCHAWKCIPTAISSVVNISKFLGFYTTDDSVRVTKIQGSMSPQLAVYPSDFYHFFLTQ